MKKKMKNATYRGYEVIRINGRLTGILLSVYKELPYKVTGNSMTHLKEKIDQEIHSLNVEKRMRKSLGLEKTCDHCDAKVYGHGYSQIGGWIVCHRCEEASEYERRHNL